MNPLQLDLLVALDQRTRARAAFRASPSPSLGSALRRTERAAQRAIRDAMRDPDGPTYQLLSVDAWRDHGGGWTWNAWYKRGTVPRAVVHLSTRQILAYLRTRGIGAAGHCAIEDDQYNLVLVDRHTRQPFYAIEYGVEYGVES